RTKLSRTMTSAAPASSNWSTMLLPIKPAPPVTKQRASAIRFIVPPRWSLGPSDVEWAAVRDKPCLCDSECGLRASAREIGVGEFDRLAAQAHGLLCSLEQANDPITSIAIADRRALLGDRVDEFVCHKLQGFRGIEVGSEHIAIPVARENSFSMLRILVDCDPLVIDPHLFRRFHVVVDNHLFRAAQQGRAHFDRRQPVQVKVSNHLTVEMSGDVRDGLKRTAEMLCSQGGDCDRVLRT